MTDAPERASRPPAPDEQIAAMVERTDRLARVFAERRWPILAFLVTHEPGKPEPPYPPHCERGTGEENFVPDLAWLDDDPHATLIRKDCINGFVGGIEQTAAQPLPDRADHAGARRGDAILVGLDRPGDVAEVGAGRPAVVPFWKGGHHGRDPGLSRAEAGGGRPAGLGAAPATGAIVARP